jgi:nicotinamidase-related amidase
MTYFSHQLTTSKRQDSHKQRTYKRSLSLTRFQRETEVIDVINQTISKPRNRDDLIIFVRHCHSSYEPIMKGKPGLQVSEKLNVGDQDHL